MWQKRYPHNLYRYSLFLIYLFCNACMPFMYLLLSLKKPSISTCSSLICQLVFISYLYCLDLENAFAHVTKMWFCKARATITNMAWSWQCLCPCDSAKLDLATMTNMARSWKCLCPCDQNVILQSKGNNNKHGLVLTMPLPMWPKCDPAN